MKNMPLISVIVPAYNVSSSIAMTLDLLQRQTYDNLEIICINDGSTDSTSDIINVLKQKDSRIVLINKENGGVSSARNIGLNNAHGEYVCFFDPGDEADSDFVMYLYKLFREQSASGQRKKQTTLLLVSAHSSGLHTDFHQLNQIASG